MLKEPKLDLKKIRDKEYGCNSCTMYETCYHIHSEANNFGKCFERYLRLCQTIALQEIAEALKPKEKEHRIPTLTEIYHRYERLKASYHRELTKKEENQINECMEKEIESWNKLINEGKAYQGDDGGWFYRGSINETD